MKNQFSLLLTLVVISSMCLLFSQCKKDNCEEEIDCSPSVFITNSSPNQAIYEGDTSILWANGGDTYLWSTSETSDSIFVNPTANTLYTVTISSNEGCSRIDSVEVNVIPLPVVNADEDQTICLGQSTTLTAAGNGTAYQWNTGQTGESISVSPVVATTYTVSVTAANGGTYTTDQITVNVENLMVDAGPPQSICLGASATLSASGTAASYSWNTGQTGQSIIVNPSSTTTYMVTTSNSNGCTATDQIVVTVSDTNANAGPNQTICLGESATLSAWGTGANYSWNTGQTGTLITVNPSSTTTYTVTASNANDCTAVAETIVTVVQENPSIEISPDQTICLGEGTNISVSGTDLSYLWNIGVSIPSVTVSPSNTTTYTVTASNANGCTVTAQTTVTVTDVQVDLGNNITTCVGLSVTIVAEGNGTYYEWSNGYIGTSLTANPSSTTTYTVTASDDFGCTATDAITVTIGSTGIPLLGPDQTICLGESTILTGSGGTSYTWSTGETTQSITVSPATTTTYSLTVTDILGCIDIDQITITVEDCGG